MPLLGAFHVRELAFDQYAPPLGLQLGADRAVDFADAEYTFFMLVVLTLKTFEERHLRHAQNLAAIGFATKDSSWISEVRPA